jgi:hypothetical protein
MNNQTLPAPFEAMLDTPGEATKPGRDHGTSIMQLALAFFVRALRTLSNVTVRSRQRRRLMFM